MLLNANNCYTFYCYSSRKLSIFKKVKFNLDSLFNIYTVILHSTFLLMADILTLGRNEERMFCKKSLLSHDAPLK